MRTPHNHYRILVNGNVVTTLTRANGYRNDFPTSELAQAAIANERPNNYYDQPITYTVAPFTVPYCVAPKTPDSNPRRNCKYATPYDEIYPMVACAGGCGKKIQQHFDSPYYKCRDCEKREMLAQAAKSEKREMLAQAAKSKRRTYPSHELPHLWVHQVIDEARVSGGNQSFKGPNYRSYSTVIASVTKNKKGETVYLVSNENYSITTAKHIHSIRHAIPNGAKVFRVAYPFIRYSIENSKYIYSVPDHIENIKDWNHTIQSELKAAATSREPKKSRLLNEAKDLLKLAKEYIAFFGIKKAKLTKVPEDVPALMKMYAKQIAAEKTRRPGRYTGGKDKAMVKTFEETAGMNYIYDAIHYLNATVGRDSIAACDIIRTYDYTAQRHYPVDARPVDHLAARLWGRGIRYTMNGRNVPGTQLVRIIGGVK